MFMVWINEENNVNIKSNTVKTETKNQKACKTKHHILLVNEWIKRKQRKTPLNWNKCSNFIFFSLQSHVVRPNRLSVGPRCITKCVITFHLALFKISFFFSRLLSFALAIFPTGTWARNKTYNWFSAQTSWKWKDNQSVLCAPITNCTWNALKFNVWKGSLTSHLIITPFTIQKWIESKMRVVHCALSLYCIK